MKISIVTATYRGAQRIQPLLSSIQQHGQGIREMLIIDDGSPEADANALGAALGAFPLPPKTFIRGARRGWIASINDAVSRTCGDVILLLDDDVLLPAGLVDVLDQLLSLPGVGVLSWRSQGASPGQSQEPRPGLVQPATQLAAYCMAFRRSLWDGLEGLDPRYHIYCSDSDFCLQATLAGHPCYRVWWPLVPHKEHQCMKDCPELERDRHVAADLATFRAKWGKSGEEMEREALGRLSNG